MWWCWFTLAGASELVERFDGADDATFLPRAGWVGGYATDPWRQSGGRVGAARDDGGGDWGSGGPIDNWIVRSDRRFQDMTLDVALQTGDDDGIGVVFRWEDADHFDLVVFASGNNLPGAGLGGTATGNGGWYYRVSDGVAEVLGYTSLRPGSGRTPLRVRAEGARTRVWVDVDADGAFDAGELAFDHTDAFASDGSVGFYCYDNGTDRGCWFDDLRVVGQDPTIDADGDGVPETEDCDDADAVRSDGVWSYPDMDEDGFGDGSASPTFGCAPPDGWVVSATDCDDADGAIAPGADERCDGVDEDCDGVADDGAVDAVLWYLDVDGDGFGDPSTGVLACEAAPGRVDGGSGVDCDDADATIHPGADEVWYDGVDQACDGGSDLDRDGDGALAAQAGGDDCDDAAMDVGPAAEDVPDDGVDQNCNGADATTYAGRASCRCASGDPSGGLAPLGWLALLIAARRRGRR